MDFLQPVCSPVSTGGFAQGQRRLGCLPLGPVVGIARQSKPFAMA
jgi:hypothetical protein